MSAIIRQIESLDEVDAAAWDALAGARDGAPVPNPFLAHAFLRALEETDCVGTGLDDKGTGWLARHTIMERDGALVAAAPSYIKLHSQGEYVFDHSWAQAYTRAGGDYYPKMQVCVPFTPATGPRLLVKPDEPELLPQFGAGLAQVALKMNLSSLHVTFATPSEADALEEAGYLHRTDQQFHWLNRDYGSYDDFLATLASRKRKALKRERRDALAGGEISIDWLTGDRITEDHWDAFWEFYQDTGTRKWGQPYLTRAFFSRLGEVMGDRVLLVMARRDGRDIAGALNMVGMDAVYGRYWGCREDHPFLHFEVCYHQAIDYAIQHGLSRVEAGAQGGHKLARGYVPVTTHSAHFIPDPGFRRAVAQYLDHEREAVDEESRALLRFAPYRRGEIGGGASPGGETSSADNDDAKDDR